MEPAIFSKADDPFLLRFRFLRVEPPFLEPSYLFYRLWRDGGIRIDFEAVKQKSAPTFDETGAVSFIGGNFFILQGLIRNRQKE